MNERNWGGKRKGAGRKKGDIVYQTVSLVLPKEEMEVLKHLADREEITVSRFISKYLHLPEYLEIRRQIERERENHSL